MSKQYKATKKTNWFQVLLIAFGLFGYALISFLPVQLEINESRWISVPYRAVFLALSIWILVKYKSCRLSYRNLSVIFILMFWTLYIIRLIYDTLFNSTELVKPLSEYWLFAIGLCFIPMLAFRIQINNDTLVKSLYGTFILCLLVNILGLIHNANNIIEYSEERQSGNEFLNPITYGQAGATLAIVSLILFIKDRKKGLRSFFFLFGVPLGIWTLILSLSRGPMIGFVILLILLVYSSLKSTFYKILSIVIIFFLIYSIILSTSLPVIGNIVDALLSTGGKDNQSDAQRLQLLTGGWNQFLSNPFFGDLLEERTTHSYPHNLIVESLMTCGIMGGILMILIQVKSIFQSSKLLNNPNTKWVALLFIMQLVGSLFSSGIYAGYSFWYLIILVNTLYFQQQIQERRLKLSQINHTLFNFNNKI